MHVNTATMRAYCWEQNSLCMLGKNFGLHGSLITVLLMVTLMGLDD